MSLSAVFRFFAREHISLFFLLSFFLFNTDRQTFFTISSVCLSLSYVEIAGRVVSIFYFYSFFLFIYFRLFFCSLHYVWLLKIDNRESIFKRLVNCLWFSCHNRFVSGFRRQLSVLFEHALRCFFTWLVDNCGVCSLVVFDRVFFTLKYF